MPDSAEGSPALAASEARSTLVELGWTDRVAALVAAAEPTDGAVPGRVVRVERDSCMVVTSTLEGRASGHPLPAVGDWVLVVDGQADGPLQVVETLPRWSRLERHAAVGATEVQVLAVNIDLVAVVLSLDTPINGARLDRELVVAWESGARPVVILTKADAHPDPASVAADVAERAAGVDVLTTSSRDGRGLDEVRAVIGPSDTLVLLGASGVGSRRWPTDCSAPRCWPPARCATAIARAATPRSRVTCSPSRPVAC